MRPHDVDAHDFPWVGLEDVRFQAEEVLVQLRNGVPAARVEGKRRLLGAHQQTADAFPVEMAVPSAPVIVEQGLAGAAFGDGYRVAVPFEQLGAV